MFIRCTFSVTCCREVKVKCLAETDDQNSLTSKNALLATVLCMFKTFHLANNNLCDKWQLACKVSCKHTCVHVHSMATLCWQPRWLQ